MIDAAAILAAPLRNPIVAVPRTLRAKPWSGGRRRRYRRLPRQLGHLRGRYGPVFYVVMIDLRVIRDYLHEEGGVVWKAPVAFLFGALLTGVIGYGLGLWHYSERISVLEAQMKTTSPEAMAKLIERVDALEKRVEGSIVPRSLSDHTKEMIKTAIERSKFEYKTIPVYSTVDPESLTYAIGFVDFFKSIGITSSLPMVTPATLDNCGVMEGIQDVNHPSDRAADFHFVLESAGLNPRYTKWADTTNPSLFDLFIGPPCSSHSR
jgi:hypothetical protein